MDSSQDRTGGWAKGRNVKQEAEEGAARSGPLAPAGLWSPSTRTALILLLVAGLLHSPFLLSGRSLTPAGYLYRTPLFYDPNVPVGNWDLFDSVIYYAAGDRFYNRCLHQGRLPMWNPCILGGSESAFNGQSGFLYPPKLLLHRLLDPDTARGWLWFFHSWLAGLGMTLLGLEFGLSRRAALLSGLAWMLNGSTMTWLENDYPVLFAAWLPWMTLWLDQSRTRPRRCLLAGLAVGACWTAGHLQWALYTTLASLLLLVARCRNRADASRLVRPGLAVLLGTCLAAPMLVPTALNLTQSQRPHLAAGFQSRTYREFLSDFLPTLVVPDAWGTPVNGFALRRVPSGGYFCYQELCVYLGVVPFCLAAWGLLAPGYPRRLGLATLASMLLPATPLWPLVNWLPGLDRIMPHRLILVAVASGCLLAGFGLDRGWPRRLGWLPAVFGLLTACWAAWLHATPAAQLAARWVAEGRVRLPAAELYPTRADYLSEVTRGIASTWAWSSPSVAWPLLFCCLAALGLALLSPRLLVAVAALDLLLFALRYNPAVPPAWIFPENATTRFLREHAQGARVAALSTVRPNCLLPYGISDVAGYESFYARRTGQFMAYLLNGDLHQARADVFGLTGARLPLLSLLGARYLVAYPGQNVAGCRLVQQTPLWIYENPRALPRAFVVARAEVEPDPERQMQRLESEEFDPREAVLVEAALPAAGPDARAGPARITSEDLHRVQVEAEGPGILVLADAYSPNWSARVDGAPASVYPVDMMLRGVVLGPGLRRVEFRYQPRGLSAGLALAALGLAGLLAVARWGVRA